MAKTSSFLDEMEAEPTTALAPATESAPAPLAEYRQFTWEDDGTDDLAPTYPIIKIVQGVSRMDGATQHIGQFWRSDTEEFRETIDVIPLYKVNTRAYFEENAEKPSCVSDNGESPRSDQPYWRGRNPGQPQFCDQCPLAQWGSDGTPARCKESLVVLVDDAGEFAQLRLSGMAISPFKQLVKRKLKPRGLPLCTQTLHLTTTEEKKDAKKWQQLVIQNQMLPVDIAQKYNALLAEHRQAFTEAARNTVDVDEAPGDDGWGNGEEAFQ